MNKIIILLFLFLLGSCNFSPNKCEIIQITPSTRYLVPKGKSIDAIDGDWIMKNDKVIAVIGNSEYGREANFRVQSIQGAVIDFTSLVDNFDYLDALYPQGYPAEDSRRNPAVFAHKIEPVKSRGREIILRATRTPTNKVPYESVTEYSLKNGENFLKIKTTYYNPGTQDVSLTFADKLRLGFDTNDASPLGEHNLIFMYDKWFNAAYGIYRHEGLLLKEEPIIGSDPAVGLLVGFKDIKSGENSTVTLAPGQRIKASRYLLYGKDVAEIQRNVMNYFGKSDAVIVTFKITDTNNEVVADVFLDVFNNHDELISFAKTNTAGVAKIPLIADDYKLQATKIGHDTIFYDFSVTNNTEVISTIMKPLTSINFNIKEKGTNRMLPVKLEFKGINGYSDPFLGPTKRAEGANNFYYAINKSSFNVPIPPGQYLVTISHGPEYRTVNREINIKRGDKKTINAEITRSFSSPDWVIADLHVHSIISGDALAETRSQIINLAALGIQFAPATEHNRIYSYCEIIKEIGLEEYIASCAGLELTGPTGVGGGPNHQNAFPLSIQEGKQSGGSPEISGDVYKQTKRLYDYDKEKVKFLMHNHPNHALVNLFFDKNRDGMLDEGWGTRGLADAIELQNHTWEILNVTSEDAKDKKAPVFYWLQMLNQGDRIFNVTTSDSHSIGAESRRGLRVVYVYTEKDDPLTIDPYEIALNAKKGRMIMTNGPFIRADINGYLPGDEVQDDGTGLNMSIEVYANNEIEINRVQLLINGRQDKKLNFKNTTHPLLFSCNGLQFKHSFPLVLKEDANIIVVATGNTLLPDANLTYEVNSKVPFAITNPFFVDLDGDGFVPNKDTLGEPLPSYSSTFMQ